MRRRRLVWFLVAAFLGVLAVGVEAQKPAKENQPEQTSFGADSGFLSKPLDIPFGALQIVSDALHRGTVACLKGHGITPEQVPGSWFAASEIHLAGPEEVDLVVQPNLPKMAAHEIPPDSAEAAGCLLGANVGPFWVIRKNPSGRYSLLLATSVLSLEVLDSKANFYRDIQTVACTAVTCTTVLYKMSVAQYQIAEKKTEPAGQPGN